MPEKAVCSLIDGKANSSLSVGIVRITDVSLALKRPPKSRNLTTYSPDFAGTIASVDAHGLTSGYSPQSRVSFDMSRNIMNLKPISRSGAPKQYPNFYVDPDEDNNTFVNTITQDTIKTSGFKKLTIYFDPDAQIISSNILDEGLEHVFPFENGGQNGTNTPKGVFKMSLLDIDRQKSKILEIGVTDARSAEIFS